MTYNPSDNSKRPVVEWDQLGAFDAALDCETSITNQFERAEKTKRKLIHGPLKCVPADFLYPHTQPKK